MINIDLQFLARKFKEFTADDGSGGAIEDDGAAAAAAAVPESESEF